VSDDDLIDAATDNRRVALVRIEHGHSGRRFHEYPVSKHFFGYESGRTCTHAIYQINPTQTLWHDRLTLVPIPEKKVSILWHPMSG